MENNNTVEGTLCTLFRIFVTGVIFAKLLKWNAVHTFSWLKCGGWRWTFIIYICVTVTAEHKTECGGVLYILPAFNHLLPQLVEATVPFFFFVDRFLVLLVYGHNQLLTIQLSLFEWSWDGRWITIRWTGIKQSREGGKNRHVSKTQCETTNAYTAAHQPHPQPTA